MRFNRWRSLATTLAILASAAISPAAAVAADPVGLTARFDRRAELGSPTALHLELRIDADKGSATTAIELLYPSSLGITTSGLGLEPCARPQSDFTSIVLDDLGLAGCHPNSVIARGTARAVVHYGTPDPAVIPEIGAVTVLTGPVAAGRLSLVVFVDGHHPFGAKLAYAGEARPARKPFGGALAITIPPLPALYDAKVLLTELRLAIGSRDLTYYDRSDGTSYHPEGVALPSSCPAAGFPFQARVSFSNGGRATANARVRCPRPARD